MNTAFFYESAVFWYVVFRKSRN